MSELPNPLVPPFPPANLKAGWEAIQQGKAAKTQTPREAEYLSAIEVFYKDYDKIDQKTRAVLYDQAMQLLHEHYPEDAEAAGGTACTAYSHIYSMLGMWDGSIRSNRAAEAAANDYVAKTTPDATHQSIPHVFDFLVYAYLQTARDSDAKRLVDALPNLKKFPVTSLGIDTALAAIPARFALERGRWDEAAQLPVRDSQFPTAQSISYFARSLGNARPGNAPAAHAEIAHLDEQEAKLAAAKDDYWAGQTRIQKQAAAAWVIFAEGDRNAAIAAMREAAALDDASEKNVAMENKLVPIRTLLGELYLAAGMNKEALVEFEASDKVMPNRFRTVAGAARAARESGSVEAAKRYYGALTALAVGGDGSRPEVSEARTYLAQN